MQPEKTSFGRKVIAFNAGLRFNGELPPGIRVMNPFRENDCATAASTAFYNRFYDDDRRRGIILGINPGRFGAGITGVPFTDPTRLEKVCGIRVPGCQSAHEPSSVFVYEVIGACGGPEKFYGKWYINSLCPLGFVRVDANGREKNYNYYDSAALKKAATPFMVECLEKQLSFGIDTRACFCLGLGRNAEFMERLNRQYGFFGRIIPLEHPRYVVQYKWRQRESYVRKYVELLEHFAD